MNAKVGIWGNHFHVSQICYFLGANLCVYEKKILLCFALCKSLELLMRRELKNQLLLLINYVFI